MNENEIKDVKDLRLNFKNSKSEDKFKKAILFGYDVKETNLYIASIEANRELEKTAFLDRIKELELLIKTLHSEKDEWENSIDNITRKQEKYEKECEAKDIQLKQSAEQLTQYKIMMEQYEKELKEREDAVVFIENASLKEQLELVIKERNQHGGQCEILKNENEYKTNKIQNLENEVNKLTDKLALEINTTRDQISDLSFQITKIVESNNFLNERTISSLVDLLFYNENCKKEADLMTISLKEKLSAMYK